MQQDELPHDILLAKLKNPLISQEGHIAMLEERHEKLATIVNVNFELMADKYRLLSGALPGCSPELIVDEFKKRLKVIEGVVDNFMNRLRKIQSDLQIFADYDQNVIRQHIMDVTATFQKSFKACDSDILDVEYILNTFSNPESQQQTLLLNLILERNQNLQNVMNKVYSEQIEFSGLFRTEFDTLVQTNHFEPLNKVLNSQKQFWTSRIQKAVAIQQKLLSADPEPLLQSTIVLPNKGQQMIETLLKLRTHTHDIMLQHYNDLKKKKQRHSKLDGGGSFGYCWTGGYGWRGLHYELLDVNETCEQCQALNQEMHATCKKLYDMEYRDKGTWWVQAWFLYRN